MAEASRVDRPARRARAEAVPPARIHFWFSLLFCLLLFLQLVLRFF